MVIAFTFSSANAAALTWDTVSGDGAAISAGSGTWDTAAGNTNWNNAGVNVAWSETSATVGLNNAVFAGTDGAYTITLATNLAATSGLTFNNSGYTLTSAAAQTLNVNGLGLVATVAAGKTATIGSNVTVAFNNGGTASNTGTRFSVGTGAVLNIASAGVLTRAVGLTSDVGTNGTIGFLGSGTVNLAGTLSYTGAATVGGGILLATTAADNIVLNVDSGGLVSSTTTANGLILANNATATATVNLNAGGTIVTRLVKEFSGTSNFNFDGGILKAGGGSTTFMTGLDSAVVKVGGAKIDSNGFNIAIGQPLIHDNALGGTLDGGLIKSGAGILTLNGASTFTGPTNVDGGTLLIGTGGSLVSGVFINNGSTVGGTGSITGSLTLSAGSGLTVDPSGPSLAVSGGVNIAGPTSISFTGPAMNGTTYDILNYSGGSLTGFANLTASSRLLLTNNTSISVVQGTVTTGIRTWNTTNGVWEVGGATLNWVEGDKKFFPGDDVDFNNPAAPSTVTLNGALLPASVIVSNTTNSYTFSGSGSITGPASLIKEGVGILLLTTNHSYTGSTVVSAGTLQLGDGTTDGTIASTSSVTNDGVLSYNWAGSHAAAYPITGTGSVVKRGAGTLTLSSVASNFTGGTSISAGTIVADGAALSGGGVSIASGATLTLSGGISSSTVTGAGTIGNNTNGVAILTGDHSGFSGNLTQNGGGNTQFNSATAGSPNASYSHLNGEIIFALSGDYTVRFGSLSSANGKIVRGGNTATGTTTVEVGGLNADSILLGPLNDGTTKRIGLTKVGTGKLTLAAGNTYSASTTINDGELAVNGASLADAGTVIINAGKLNLTGTETVDKLFFGGVQQPAGNYTATGDSIHFSGPGTLVVTSPRLGYSGWAAANAPGQTKDQDHDFDGVANGIEYFMGLSGNGFTSNPALASGTVTWIKGGSYTGTYGIDYVVQSSPDLLNWTNVPVGSGPLGTVVSDTTSLSYTPPAGQTARFGRLVVNN